VEIGIERWVRDGWVKWAISKERRGQSR